MDTKLMAYQPQLIHRGQHRTWLSLHIIAYILFCLLQSALLPVDPLALALRSVLFAIILMHLSLLYTTHSPVWTQKELVVQPVALLPEQTSHKRQDTFNQNDFWFRWHDIGSSRS